MSRHPGEVKASTYMTDNDRVKTVMEQEDNLGFQMDVWLKFRPKYIRYSAIILQLMFGLFGVYVFLVALALFGSGLLTLTKGVSRNLFQAADAPAATLCIGILATAFIHSSSTTTSITVQLVAAKLVEPSVAVFLIIGANIGTTVTNLMVSLFYGYESIETYSRSVRNASCHGFFNLFNSFIFFSLEYIVGMLNPSGEGLLLLLSKATIGSGGSGNTREVDFDISTIYAGLLYVFLQIDKDVLQDHSSYPASDKVVCKNAEGLYQSFDFTFVSDAAIDAIATLNLTSDCISPFTSEVVSGNICVSEDTCDLCCAGVYDSLNNVVQNLEVAQSGFLHIEGSDEQTGLVSTIVAFFMLIGSIWTMIYFFAHVITSNGKGVLRKIIRYDFVGGGYFSIFIGTVLTIIISSSSIVTSLLTVLAAADAIDLEHVFPLTLGANIGTTFTAVLSGLASADDDATQIAMVHVYFNVLGVLIWYPLHRNRAFIMNSAVFMGEMCKEWWTFPRVYLILVYIIYPSLLLGLSLGFHSENKGLQVFASLCFIVIVASNAYAWYEWRFGKGKEKGLAKMKAIEAWIKRKTFTKRVKGSNNKDKDERDLPGYFLATPFQHTKSAELI